MTGVENLGAARSIRKMSKEMADQKEGEAKEKEVCRDQIKESDKEEVGESSVGVSGNRWASWGWVCIGREIALCLVL